MLVNSCCCCCHSFRVPSASSILLAIHSTQKLSCTSINYIPLCQVLDSDGVRGTRELYSCSRIVLNLDIVQFTNDKIIEIISRCNYRLTYVVSLVFGFLHLKKYQHLYDYESETYKCIYLSVVRFINGNTKIKNKKIILTFQQVVMDDVDGDK